MLDVFSIARVGDLTADGYRQVVADPADLYPAAIAHIRSRLQTASVPDGALRQEWDTALTLPTDAWEAALVDGSALVGPAREARAAALECARRWFTEVLHQAIGGPMQLKITKDLTYKL